MPFRSTTPARALSAAAAEVSRLGLTASATTFAGVNFGGVNLGGVNFGGVARVALFRDGVEVSVGGGDSLVSAYFEALERYFLSATRDMVLRPAREVAAQPALSGDLVVQRWAGEFPSAMAACSAYGDVSYPRFLVDPRYFRSPVPGDDVDSHRALLRYSSSLGTAAGADRVEAEYHGLCELIEHDALSHALLRWYIAGDPAADEVEPVLSAGALSRRLADAERAVGAAVRLLDVTTDLGVPAYLAVGGGRLGSGASVRASDAAHRALGELIQLSGEPVPQRRKLSRWPALDRCARVPLDGLTFRKVSLRPDPPGDGTPAWGLAEVTRALAVHGIAHHTRELTPADSLISVTSTIAPGLERFSLVRHGDPVLPTGRGRRLWPSRETAAA